MIIFSLLERRKPVAIDFAQRPSQRLGARTVGNALEAGDGGLAAVLNVLERQFAPPDI